MQTQLEESKKKSVNPNIELISVHVPKTAGTAFTRILLRVYGPEQVFLDYPYDKDYQRWFMKNGNPKIKVIHGHFQANKYNRHFPEAKKIVWLRNPINLLISCYFFNQSFRRGRFYHLFQEKSTSFEDFIEMPENQNIMCFYLQDQKIKDFYFVGIQDFFEEDFQKLKRILDWPDVKISKENNNLYSDYKSLKKEVLGDSKLIEKVTNLNQKDLELYQEALSLRKKL
jgi:hypothetical protein